MEAPRFVSRVLYRRQLQQESDIEEAEINARMRWDLPIPSNNYKCSVSLDLPLGNCVPTNICRQVCYAAQGRQFYRKSIIKALAVNRLISLDPEHVAHKIVDEAAGRIIRIAGSGEILPGHASLVTYTEQLGGYWWGFTRRPDTHQSLPALMFSFDAATPAPAMNYVSEHVPVNRRAYLRGPQDPLSSIDSAVTFPVLGPLTSYVSRVLVHETDCPFDQNEVEGCWSGKRCY